MRGLFQYMSANSMPKAVAVVACPEGQPQEIPFSSMPKLNESIANVVLSPMHSACESSNELHSGDNLPVIALYILVTVKARKVETVR